MSYAQKNYPQIQGINGRYSIASIGCFLTAFCNLEADFDYNVNPLDLNNWFVAHNGYVDIDDGIRDDLGWTSITQLDPSTVIGHTVDHGTDQTAGWPSTNQSIVRFYYRSVQSGQMIFHFCKVADHASSLIIDSWDGLVKKSPYGEPTAWAEYNHGQPTPVISPTPVQKYTVTESYDTGKQIKLNKQPTYLWGMNYDFDYMQGNPIEVHAAGEIWTVTNKVHHNDGSDYYRRAGQVDGFNVLDCDDYAPPVVQLPTAPLSAPSDEQYEVITPIKGYLTSNRAINHIGAGDADVAKGTYWIFNKTFVAGDANTPTSLNITTKQGAPGSWINPVDNVVAPRPISVWTTTPVNTTVTSTDVVKLPDWRTTYKPFKNAQGQNEVRRYVTMQTVAFKDLESKLPDITLVKPQEVNISGTFIKDNILYLRPKKMVDQFLWYGALEVDSLTHKANLELYDEVYATDTSIEDRVALETASIKDYIVRFLSSLKGYFAKLINKKD